MWMHATIEYPKIEIELERRCFDETSGILFYVFRVSCHFFFKFHSAINFGLLCINCRIRWYFILRNILFFCCCCWRRFTLSIISCEKYSVHDSTNVIARMLYGVDHFYWLSWFIDECFFGVYFLFSLRKLINRSQNDVIKFHWTYLNLTSFDLSIYSRGTRNVRLSCVENSWTIS